jgi:putative FmdB family regulatory protein
VLQALGRLTEIGVRIRTRRRRSVVPTYAYRCAACDHRFEAVQRMADAPLTECPVCTGSVKRVIQNVPVVFKGSGWYKTDSRKSTAPAGAEGSGSDGKGKAESTEKASEKAKSAKPEPVVAAAD